MLLVSAQGLVVILCCVFTSEAPPPEESIATVPVVTDTEQPETTPLLVTKPTTRNLGTSGYFFILVLASFADGMSILSLHSTLASLLMLDYGWNQQEIGAMNGVYALVCILTTWFLLRPVIEWLGAFHASLWGILIKTASIAFVGLMVDKPWRFYCAACLLFGLVYNLANPSLVALISDMCRTFEPERMGTLIGVFRSANSVGSSLGPAVAVQLLTINPMLPFGVLAGTQLFIFAVIGVMKIWDTENWFLANKTA